MSPNTFARHRAPPAVAVLFGLLALAGCGSAASDTAALAGEERPAAYPGSITVSSAPPGARCVLTNAANQSAVAEITTPGQVTLARGTAIIEARCSAPGRLDTVVMIRPVRDFARNVHHPQPTGPTALLQIAEARSSGRTRRYDDMTVYLPPMPFASVEARDAWFAERAEATRREAARFIGRAQRAPQATMDTAEDLQRHLAEDLARLDQQKAAATIAPPEPEPEPPPTPRRRR